MKNPNGKLDRHKVAACYIIAIATVKPMRLDFESEENGNFYFIANEHLAITIGLSLLRAFVITAIEKNENISNEEKNVLKKKFEKGVQLPSCENVNHGNYLENYASEIRFAINAGSISILSIAHELYLLEVLTKSISEIML